MNFKNFTFLLAFIILSIKLDAQVFSDFTVTQCDSLINANVDNPNFIILDVRTPGEYNPEHLEGAINRNFYDSDFSEQLDILPKHKTYLIHCLSGGRSGVTIGMMENLGFTLVYNMLGGMNAWNAASLPVTTAYSPQFMAVSNTVYELENIPIGTTDTINITITNRGNLTLTFESITDLSATEFETNFDQNIELDGSDDYTFSIYYTPVDALEDHLVFTIESNSGSQYFNIYRVGEDSVSPAFELSPNNVVRFFPMPASDYLTIVTDFQLEEVMITDISGRSFGKFIVENGVVTVSSLKSGVYLVYILKKESVIVEKIVIK